MASAQKRLEMQLCDVVRKQSRGQAGPIPEAGRVLFDAFASLSDARSWNANGPNPISFADMGAWCSLMRVPLDPHHVSIITAMDQAWIGAFYRKQEALPEGVKALPPISEHPLNATLLDMMMG